ncbi:hypothetical protein C0995_014319 [Termitomyces sp. Mi166|nr:hypothetical protein C0995_014319 [Termitomyces sp. Mi166\
MHTNIRVIFFKGNKYDIIDYLGLQDATSYVTFTPTRPFLRGPFPTHSNRIVRKYPGLEDHFIRVAFRDEALSPYRESSEADMKGLIRRVGSILSQGFDAGGRLDGRISSSQRLVHVIVFAPQTKSGPRWETLNEC